MGDEDHGAGLGLLKAELESRFIGSSPGVVALRGRLAPLCDLDVDVLVNGETGTGKEVVARALYDLGRRRGRPFMALNCAAIPAFEAGDDDERLAERMGMPGGARARLEGHLRALHRTG
ncbi:DNA-binding NtrC family response regulator [Shinella fusca]|uniref:DNA-binding NtrC family response regulator n=1 Tax=Shinella fusca TaxID=544480 RepID=A0A7W7YU43_9HYPH|nr:DNA-binding NtrC family response regulator [Shinella fusca]